MKLGLLWYDADRRITPQARLADAADRYAARFGRRANCCHVNPEQLFDDTSVVIVADPAVLKNHIWVGRDEALEPERPRRGRKAAALPAPLESPVAVAEPGPSEPSPSEPVAAEATPAEAPSMPDPVSPAALGSAPAPEAPAKGRRKVRQVVASATEAELPQVEVPASPKPGVTPAKRQRRGRVMASAEVTVAQTPAGLSNTPGAATTPTTRRSKGRAETPAVPVQVPAAEPVPTPRPRRGRERMQPAASLTSLAEARKARRRNAEPLVSLAPIAEVLARPRRVLRQTAPVGTAASKKPAPVSGRTGRAATPAAPAHLTGERHVLAVKTQPAAVSPAPRRSPRVTEPSAPTAPTLASKKPAVGRKVKVAATARTPRQPVVRSQATTGSTPAAEGKPTGLRSVNAAAAPTPTVRTGRTRERVPVSENKPTSVRTAKVSGAAPVTPARKHPAGGKAPTVGIKPARGRGVKLEPATPGSAAGTTRSQRGADPKPAVGPSPSKRTTASTSRARPSSTASGATSKAGKSGTSGQPVAASSKRRGGISEASASRRPSARAAG